MTDQEIFAIILDEQPHPDFKPYGNAEQAFYLLECFQEKLQLSKADLAFGLQRSQKHGKPMQYEAQFWYHSEHLPKFISHQASLAITNAILNAYQDPCMSKTRKLWEAAR